jgi:hypothetical protein
MRINSVFFKSVLAATLTLPPYLCFSQRSIGEALKSERWIATTVPYCPFDRTVITSYKQELRGGGIENITDTTVNRLYEDVQLTRHFTGTEECGATLGRKIPLPDSDRLLLSLLFGNNYGGYGTSVLCIVTPDGTILDTLEGLAKGYEVSVKQFRVTDKYQVIVTTIHAVSPKSILFKEFTSFEGYRQDVTYSINEKGKFVKVKTQTFQPKTYTLKYLSNEKCDLWNGGETLKE